VQDWRDLHKRLTAIPSILRQLESVRKPLYVSLHIRSTELIWRCAAPNGRAFGSVLSPCHSKGANQGLHFAVAPELRILKIGLAQASCFFN
jgi:hypothetical protein